jgi:hypothetical protein
MKRIAWTLPILAMVAACGQPEESASQGSGQQDSAVSESGAGNQPPDINEDVTTGVALDFKYLFSLPESRIGSMQQEHAALCAKLGITRCRVTDLKFNKARDGAIEAMMAFAVERSLALGFAADATALVERAEGKLATSEVTGGDVGSGIVTDDDNAAAIERELSKLKVELKVPGLRSEVTERIIDRQQELRDELETIKAGRNEKVQSLATTPVTFTYESGDTVLGMDRSAPFRRGLSAGETSFSVMLGFIALLFGAAAPWALLGLGLFWVIRRIRQPKTGAVADQA